MSPKPLFSGLICVEIIKMNAENCRLVKAIVNQMPGSISNLHICSDVSRKTSNSGVCEVKYTCLSVYLVLMCFVPLPFDLHHSLAICLETKK